MVMRTREENPWSWNPDNGPFAGQEGRYGEEEPGRDAETVPSSQPTSPATQPAPPTPPGPAPQEGGIGEDIRQPLAEAEKKLGSATGMAAERFLESYKSSLQRQQEETQRRVRMLESYKREMDEVYSARRRYYMGLMGIMRDLNDRVAGILRKASFGASPHTLNMAADIANRSFQVADAIDEIKAEAIKARLTFDQSIDEELRNGRKLSEEIHTKFKEALTELMSVTQKPGVIADVLKDEEYRLAPTLARLNIGDELNTMANNIRAAEALFRAAGLSLTYQKTKSVAETLNDFRKAAEQARQMTDFHRQISSGKTLGGPIMLELVQKVSAEPIEGDVLQKWLAGEIRKRAGKVNSLQIVADALENGGNVDEEALKKSGDWLYGYGALRAIMDPLGMLYLQMVSSGKEDKAVKLLNLWMTVNYLAGRVIEFSPNMWPATLHMWSFVNPSKIRESLKGVLMDSAVGAAGIVGPVDTTASGAGQPGEGE